MTLLLGHHACPYLGVHHPQHSRPSALQTRHSAWPAASSLLPCGARKRSWKQERPPRHARPQQRSLCSYLRARSSGLSRRRRRPGGCSGLLTRSCLLSGLPLRLWCPRSSAASRGPRARQSATRGRWRWQLRKGLQRCTQRLRRQQRCCITRCVTLPALSPGTSTWTIVLLLQFLTKPCRYGPDVGEATYHSLNAAGRGLDAWWSARRLGVKAVAKTTAKVVVKNYVGNLASNMSAEPAPSIA